MEKKNQDSACIEPLKSVFYTKLQEKQDRLQVHFESDLLMLSLDTSYTVVLTQGLVGQVSDGKLTKDRYKVPFMVRLVPGSHVFQACQHNKREPAWQCASLHLSCF